LVSPVRGIQEITFSIIVTSKKVISISKATEKIGHFCLQNRNIIAKADSNETLFMSSVMHCRWVIA